ncbi:hypothetical protein [Nocardia panacis]|uniref:hypothetical protein n=1 Tax=Nocardia panacis TaxID=2340916 RepID=UPI0011C44200|nr:hypothetical protein [Nocardia panacis]
MFDLDPLTGNIDQLQASLKHRASASLPDGAVTVEVCADGSLHRIRLTDTGRGLDADTLLDTVVHLHATALADARQSVAVAVDRIEKDPRLRAQRDRKTDALVQPLPEDAAPAKPSAAEKQLPQQFTEPAPDPWASPGRKTTSPSNVPRTMGPPSVQRPKRNPEPADWDDDDEYFEQKRRDGWLV